MGNCKNASHMMQEDLGKIHRYRDVIKNVAEEKDIDPAVIAAIISRDHIQVSDNPVEKLSEVTNKLADCIGAIRSKFPTWTREQQLKGGIAAYKAAARSIHSYEHVDEYTPGGNYSTDIVSRAEWFRTNINF